MRTGGCGVFVVLGLLLAPGGAMRPARAFGADPAAENGWLSSFDEARAQARQTGKPLMVVLRCVP
jgi:hypothetical protein